MEQRIKELEQALQDIVGDADSTGCDGAYVVSAEFIERAQQLLEEI